VSEIAIDLFSKKLDIISYLQNDPLKSLLYLTSNGSLTFHWSDWEKTCQFQKSYIAQNIKNANKFNLMARCMEELKKQKVWIQDDTQIKSMSYYSVYENYVHNKFKNDNETSISIESEKGPFHKLSTMNWFDKEIYMSFLYLKLLSENMNYREFSLGANIPVSCEYNGNQFDKTMVYIHKISKSGFVLKFLNSNDYLKFINSDKVFLNLPVKEIQTLNDLDLNNLIHKLSRIDFFKTGAHEYNQIELNPKLLTKCNHQVRGKANNNKESFFFIKADKLNSSTGKKFTHSLGAVVDKFEKYFVYQIFNK
jgi:hypothetical protein